MYRLELSFNALRFEGISGMPKSYLLIFNPLANSKDMTVWMPHMHLPNIPRHVGWGPSDIEALLHAVPVDSVDVVNPDDIQTPLSAASSPSGPNVIF
jgi:hypothetical protein